MSDFIHIHVHSDFSILDGISKVSELAKKASENKMKHLCVTDHGMAAATPSLIEQCEKYKINPIFGCEFYVNNYHHLVPDFKNLSDEYKKLARKNNHLILIAKTNKGYENLVKLVSESWINGFYYKPRISWELIEKYHEGLICSSACLGSELSQLTLQEKFPQAIDFIKKYKDVFNEDFFIEMQMIGIPEQDFVNKIFLKLSDKTQTPLVMTNDVHYCEKEHSELQQIVLLLNSKGTVNKKAGLEFHTDQLWFKTENEMDEMWEKYYKNDIPLSEYSESKLNTFKMCEKCDVKIDTSPKFPLIENSENLMSEICINSLKNLGLYNKKEYRDRFLKEYALIVDKGYCSYFMCVNKIMNWVKQEGHLYGSGRGSGGGSLICFLLGITEIDPIKHDLLFERFLSPSRGGKSINLQFSENI